MSRGHAIPSTHFPDPSHLHRAAALRGNSAVSNIRDASRIQSFPFNLLDGAWLIGLEPASDNREFFARTFCTREFAERGLETAFVQHSTSFSTARGTIRGMHFQREPAAEVKVVSCVRGAIYDVIVDLRKRSPTYRRWQGFELSTENRLRLYIPAGYAHGFQTLSDDAEVEYLISEFYAPDSASGVRYDDPAFAISWPPVGGIDLR